jgi:hypothetical protein
MGSDTMKLYRLIILLFISFTSLHVDAVTGRNPTGVNVRSHGATTVFITFQGLATGQQAVRAIWCGDITTGGGVSATNPCATGTIFGSLALRNDQSSTSGTGGVSNFTDIMTIPSSVSRRAFQEAVRGKSSEFFYVREFSNPTQFVTVTCRMAGGGARVPFALTDVQVRFTTDEGKKPIYAVGIDEPLPDFGADIRYNGTGRLKGRWELVYPGDVEPSTRDLLTEATLPVEQRGTQQRYTLLERFEVFLTPTGKYYLPGPKFVKPPTQAGGLYRVLLRVEATGDKEGNSNTLSGVANTGGVAGFPMPVLRYYVGTPDETDNFAAPVGQLALVLPGSDARISTGNIEFTWVDIPNTNLYKVELENTQGSVLSAIIKSTETSYSAPPWLKDEAGVPLRWRVVAVGENGTTIAKSEWRNFVIDGS